MNDDKKLIPDAKIWINEGIKVYNIDQSKTRIEDRRPSIYSVVGKTKQPEEFLP